MGIGSPVQAKDGPKISDDLKDAAKAPSSSKTSWIKTSGAVTYAKVVIVADSTDPDLVALRRAIVAAGGTVFYKYLSISGVLAMLPLDQVATIAARADVASMSADRVTTRTFSAVETMTGVSNALRETYVDRIKVQGADGSGVGIAFLDSGLMRNHKALLDTNGAPRIAKGVDITALSTSSSSPVLAGGSWAPGQDYTISYFPGSATQKAIEQIIDSSNNKFVDGYGHGTHVATIAAGRGGYNTTDTSGVAPGASLYDVRVLDAYGQGHISDALAGIDWVIYHAREYGIKVLNVSLASDSTESYVTDPLCRAVRSAVASGITVVVAAGNYGVNAAGQKMYGTIGSPGNEPAAITVGSANFHGGVSRSTATVNLFSSRGPTRGGSTDANGVRTPDNVLKPDLVAPGNRILGALATDESGKVRNWIASRNPQLVVTTDGTKTGTQLLVLSGTSIAAPAVSGAAALLLQSNPGLTPPLVKAILQYTAQPLPAANLVEQGSGLLNVDGAVRLARSLRKDIASAIDARTIAPGDSLLTGGWQFATPTTLLATPTSRGARSSSRAVTSC